jgi:hypothetical protein
MYSKESDFNHYSSQSEPRRMRQNRPRRRRQRRRWLFPLLLVALLLLALLAFGVARYLNEAYSDQSYVGLNNQLFEQIIIGPKTMAPTIESVQISTFDNKAHLVHKISCYAVVGSQFTLEYEQQDISLFQSLLGFHSGIKPYQVDGCAPQLACLLHTGAKCASAINAKSNPHARLTVKALPFTIPQTGNGKVTYSIVTTRDGIAVSTPN